MLSELRTPTGPSSPAVHCTITMIGIHFILCHLGVLVVVDGGAGVAEVGGQQRGLAVHQRVEHVHPLPGVVLTYYPLHLPVADIDANK